MKVLLDINILLDFFLKREPFYQEAEKLFLLVEDWLIDWFISWNSIDTFDYIMKSNWISRKESILIIEKCISELYITEINEKTIRKALSYWHDDLEDQIIYGSALYEWIDYIISRNTKDFPQDWEVKVLSASDFIKIFNTNNKK